MKMKVTPLYIPISQYAVGMMDPTSKRLNTSAESSHPRTYHFYLPTSIVGHSETAWRWTDGHFLILALVSVIRDRVMGWCRLSNQDIYVFRYQNILIQTLNQNNLSARVVDKWCTFNVNILTAQLQITICIIFFSFVIFQSSYCTFWAHLWSKGKWYFSRSW